MLEAQKHPVVFSGLTSDGKTVLKGIFKLTSSIGIPLGIVLMKCQENDSVVDWIDYYKTALDSGMSSNRILTRIDTEVSDVCGPEYRDEVIKRLKYYIKR